MALASNITVAESGVAAQINEMAREKGAAVAVADRKLKKNVDPQEVYDELLASVASIDAKYASIIPASDSSGYNADKGNVEDVVVDENGRVLKRSGR